MLCEPDPVDFSVAERHRAGFLLFIINNLGRVALISETGTWARRRSRRRRAASCSPFGPVFKVAKTFLLACDHRDSPPPPNVLEFTF